MKKHDWSCFSKPNRKASHSVKKGLFWCPKCDMELLPVGVKCKTCGYTWDKPRLKKEVLP